MRFRRAVAAVGIAGALIWGCKDFVTNPGGAAVRAARQLQLDSAQFVLIDGDTFRLKATVLDQRDSAFAALPTGVALAWSSSAPAIATVDTAGLVRGVGPGQAQITATVTTAGGAFAASAAATVLQPVVRLVALSGSGQQDSIGETLPQSLAVQALDRAGRGVPAVTIAFAVHGGAVSTASATTDGTGTAKVAWTLPSTLGVDSVLATTALLADSTAIFVAHTTAGAPVAVAVVSGNGQTGTVGATLAAPLVVKVTDRLGDVVQGDGVTWAAVSGGGSVTPSTSPTGATGQSQTAWTLGSAAGAQSATATATGVATPVTFTATAAAGAPASIAVSGGNNQTATAGTAVAIAPAVVVKDQFGNLVAGAAVTFAVASGGGSVTGASQTTAANGIATVGSWTLGGVAGANSLTATATGSGIGGNPVAFAATGTAGAPASIAVSDGNNQTATAGTAVAIAPAVVVKDQFGNLVAGAAVTFAVASGGGSVTGASQTTGANGIATVGSWTLGGVAGANSLTATATGSGIAGNPVAFAATGTAGAPASIALSAGNGQSATVGTAVAVAPAVVVKDQFGNLVAGAAVTFAVTTGGGSVTGASQTTAANGIATVGSWKLGTAAGLDSLTATATGSGIAGNPVRFGASAVPGSPASIAITAGNNQSATVGAGVAVAPSVVVKDAFGNPVSGVAVTFAVTTGGGSVTGASQTTNASGVAAVGSWTLGTVAGLDSLSATASGSGIAGNPVLFGATATVGAPASIAASAGNGQTATVGAAVAAPPAVIVKDALGNPVSGVAVTFAVKTGGGSVTGASQTTGANGVATVGSWTMGAAVGLDSLSATASGSGIAGNPVLFGATATVGAPASIAISAGNNQTAQTGAAVAVAPAVVVKDALGNPVSGVAVTFAVKTGGGSVTGGSQTTGANGVAAVGSWTMGALAGADSLTATATGSGIAGNPVAFGATATTTAPPTITVSAGNGESATAGSAVAVAPAVIVKDGSGNPIAGVAVTFAVKSGGGSVTGATPTTNASGIATVGSWTLGTTAGPDSLTATASGGSYTGNPVTFTATGIAGTAASIAVNGGSSGVGSPGITVPVPISVIVKDANGNPVAGVTVTFAVTKGGGSVTGATQTTNSSGIATLGSWTLGTVAGPDSLSATATGSGIAGNPALFGATVIAGQPASIAVSAGNGQSATVGASVGLAPAVIVKDAFGNPDSGVAVTFAVTLGGGSVTGATPTTGANGIATVGSWKMGSVAGLDSLTATATGSGISGNPVHFGATATAGAPASIAVSTGNNQSATVGTNVGVAPAVIVKDAQGNPVSGVTVTFAVATGGGSVTGATPATGANGVATVGSWKLGAVAGANTLTATATGSGITGNPVTFTATGNAIVTQLLRTWVGGDAGGPTDWSNANNWSPVGVPDAGDTALIPGTTNSPTLTANASVAQVRLTGDLLTVNGHTLTVGGPLVNTGGALVMTNAQDSVIVVGTATLSGGDETGKLTAGVLVVDGNFSLLPGSGSAFIASGTHTTVLAGTQPQAVYVAYASGNQEHFQNLVLAGTGSVALQTRIPVLGNVSVTGVGAVTGSDTLYVVGNLTAGAGTSLTMPGLEVGGALSVGGTYAVGVTNFIGSGQSVPVLPYTTVAVTGGPATAAGGLTLGGKLIVRSSGSLALGGRTTAADSVIINANTLTVGGHTLAASGSLVNTGGALVMTSAQDSVVVTGNVTFQGGDETGKLTAGVLEVYGNFDAPPGSGGMEFNPSGTHTTVLPATQPQTVYLAYSGGNGSHFQNLVVAGAGPVTLSGRIPVLGNMSVSGIGTAVVGNDTLYVGGNLTTGAGTALSLQGLEIGGALGVGGGYTLGVTNFIGSGQSIPVLPYTTVAVTGGPTTAAGVLAVNGNLIVRSNGALTLGGRTAVVDSVIINANTLTAGGNTLAIASAFLNTGGALVMTSALDSVIVAGNATFQGGDESGKLTAGVLEVYGNLNAPPGSGGGEFNPSGTHTTVLPGAQSQTVSLTYAGGNGSHFQNLVLAGTGPVNLATRAPVLGNATLTGTVAVTGSDTMYVGGNLTTAVGTSLTLPGVEIGSVLNVSGTYAVGVTNFIGTGQTIPAVTYTNVFVTGGPASLASRVATSGGVSVTNSGTLTIGGHTLAVGGSYYNPVGGLVMTNAQDSVIVAGNATFQGGDETGKLTAGILEVYGNFNAPGGSGGIEFDPSGTHTTVFPGTASQTVSFSYPGTGNGSHFQNLVVAGTGPVNLASRVVAQGNATLNGAVAVTGTDTLYVGGNLTTAVGTSLTLPGVEIGSVLNVSGTYAVGVTNFIGNGQTIPAVSYTNLVATGGPTSIASRVATSGNVTVTNSATLTLGGHTLEAGGALTVNSAASLTMTNPADSAIAHGNATFTASGEGGNLSAGVLVVDGNLSAPGGPGGVEFAASGTHTTVLAGTQPQSVSLYYSGGNNSHFQNLVLGGSGAVTLSGRIPALGNVSVTGTGAVGGTDTLYAGGNFTTGTGTTFNLPGVEVGGTFAVHGLYHANVTNFFGTNQVIPAGVSYDTLAVTGPGATTQDTTATVPVVDSGAYIQRGNGSLKLGMPGMVVYKDALIGAGSFDLNGHALYAVDTLIVSGSGVVVMTNAADSLATSSVSWGGGDETGKLTAGVLGIFGGSFIQPGGQTAYSFVTSGTFTTELYSTNASTPGTQQISLTYSGNANFTNLDVSGDTSGVTLGSNVTVTGVLSDSFSTTHQGIIGNGHTLTVGGGVNIASEIFDHVLLHVNGPLTQFNNVTFQDYGASDNQFSVATNGTYSLTGLTFSSTPVAGHYVVATASGGALNITISSNLSPSAAALLTQLIGSATVTWM